MIKGGKINKSCMFLINFGICTSRRPMRTQGCRADDDDDDYIDDDYYDMHFSSDCARKTQSVI